MFLGLANFYYCFIQSFIKIARLFISILGTVNLFKNFLKNIIEDDKLMVGGNNNSGQNLAKSKRSKNYKNLAQSKKSKNHPKSSKNIILNKSEILINLIIATNAGATGYQTAKIVIPFICLRQAFTKALIFQNYLECYIWIETYTSGYAIGRVFNQLSFNWVNISILTKSNLG